LSTHSLALPVTAFTTTTTTTTNIGKIFGFKEIALKKLSSASSLLFRENKA